MFDSIPQFDKWNRLLEITVNQCRIFIVDQYGPILFVTIAGNLSLSVIDELSPQFSIRNPCTGFCLIIIETQPPVLVSDFLFKELLYKLPRWNLSHFIGREVNN